MPQEFFVCIAAQSHVRCPAFVKLAYWAQDLSSVIFSLLCSVHSVSRPKITAYWDVWGDASPLGLSCFCPCTRISSVCHICLQIPIELWEGKSRSQTSRAEVEVGASFELFPIVAILSFARRISKGNLKKKHVLKCTIRDSFNWAQGDMCALDPHRQPHWKSQALAALLGPGIEWRLSINRIKMYQKASC